MFLVDTSTSTDANAMLTNVEEALNEFVGGLPGHEGIDHRGRRRCWCWPLTCDVELLREAVTDLARWRGWGHGGRAGPPAGSRPPDIGTVVLFTDGVQEERISTSVAEGGLDEAGAMMHVIALDADGFDANSFSGMVDSSGGTMTVTDDPESIGDHLHEPPPRAHAARRRLLRVERRPGHPGPRHDRR